MYVYISMYYSSCFFSDVIADVLQADRFKILRKGTQRKKSCLVDTLYGHYYVQRTRPVGVSTSALVWLL